MTHELYKTKEEIESWLKKYQVINYELIEDKEYGYVVNVNEELYLGNKNLKKILIKFNIIHGNFYCHNNNLVTMKGFPKEIKGHLNMNNNKIKSLKYCSEFIDGDMKCIENNLQTLKFFPKKISGKCYLIGNDKLKNIYHITSFKELQKIHKVIELNQKLKRK